MTKLSGPQSKQTHFTTFFSELKDPRRTIGHFTLDHIGNQGNLEQAILDTAQLEKPCSIDIWDDFGHGRIEKRMCRAYSNLGHIEKATKWSGLKTIFVIDSLVEYKYSGKISSEQRLYLSSLPAGAKQLNIKTREHWSIENNLH